MHYAMHLRYQLRASVYGKERWMLDFVFAGLRSVVGVFNVCGCAHVGVDVQECKCINAVRQLRQEIVYTPGYVWRSSPNGRQFYFEL